jgi:hypothetical protein
MCLFGCRQVRDWPSRACAIGRKTAFHRRLNEPSTRFQEFEEFEEFKRI